MTYRDLSLRARGVAGWLVALLGVSLPLSTALDGVLTALLLLAWLLAAPARLQGWRDTRMPAPILAALALFGILALACLWAPVPPRAAWGSLSKYLDLVLIPLFAWAAATAAVRRRALVFFLGAIVLNLAVSYGTAFGFWESFPGTYSKPHYPIGFRLSVTHNLLVSLAALLFLLLARELRMTAPRIAAASLGLALACIFNVLFVVIGRTGYVVVAVLILYFACTVARERRTLLLSLLLVTALFASAYFGSQFFPARVQDIASDFSQWRSGADEDTSVGHRLGYYGTTLEIVREHPLTGVGTGGFAQAYADRIRGTPARATVNPHNDYLMLAAQAGLAALALLCLLYGLLWRDAPRLGSAFERDAMRGLVLTVAIGGLFNTLLMDHVEGLLFAWAVGVLYGARVGGGSAKRTA